ncbi:hypothetical protein Trydic_g10912 [Trypoxylus dichotomus]
MLTNNRNLQDLKINRDRNDILSESVVEGRLTKMISKHGEWLLSSLSLARIMRTLVWTSMSAVHFRFESICNPKNLTLELASRFFMVVAQTISKVSSAYKHIPALKILVVVLQLTHFNSGGPQQAISICYIQLDNGHSQLSTDGFLSQHLVAHS